MRSVLKPGFYFEPRTLSIKALHKSPQCCVSDRDGHYLWEDGTVNSGSWHFHSEPQAAEALKAYACSAIDWLTREEVFQEAQKGPLEAVQCSILHWKQIQAAGLRGYTDAAGKNLVSVCMEYCSMCQLYYNRGPNAPCANCPLGEESGLVNKCFKEYQDFISTGKANEASFQETTSAIIKRLQAHEAELLKAVKKPESVLQYFRLGDVARMVPSGNIYINTANPEKPWQLIKIQNPTACAKLGLCDLDVWPTEVFTNALNLIEEP